MYERLTQEQLASRLKTAGDLVAIGARYRHYKELTYKVLALALREEDSEPCVVYQAEYGEKLTWLRPVASWIEEVEINGKKLQRFEKITTD